MHDAVYKVAVTIDDTRPEDPEEGPKLKQTRWVEWVDPGALWFVTATTLVSVTGSGCGDARALAARLPPARRRAA